MKKIIAILLAGLLAISFTACGGFAKSDDAADATDAVTETEAKTAEADDTDADDRSEGGRRRHR